MLKLHTLIPAFHPQDFATMYYPPVTAYIYLVVLAPVMLVAYLLSHAPSLSVYAQQLILDPTLPWVATRVTTAFIGALTVYLIGRLAEKIYPGSGIFAALFLATSFQHVTFSHIARHWAPSMLWIVALMWTGWHMLARASKRWYLLSGLLVGLAVGTGVLAGLLGIIPALTHFIRRGAFTQKLLSKNFWIFVATSVVLSAFFLALNPVVIHNLMPANQGSTIANSKSLLGLGILMVTEVRDFAQSETILFLFALLGIPYLLIRNRKFALVLVLSMLFAVASLYLFHYYILHYLTLELPLLTVLAGIGAYEIISMVPRNRGKLVLAIAIFLLPALIALRFSFLWTQPDTRHDARAYIEAHISPDARILSYTPNMKVVWPTAGSMKERLAFDPASSRLLDTTLLGLASSSYPAPSFNVFEIGTLSPDGVTKLTPGFLKSERFNYVVIDRSATKYPALEALIASGTIIAKFPSSGPAIDILANEISDFNFNPMALDVFEIKQLGPEVWIVQLPQ
jgi:hypothetical protein